MQFVYQPTLTTKGYEGHAMCRHDKFRVGPRGRGVGGMCEAVDDEIPSAQAYGQGHGGLPDGVRDSAPEVLVATKTMQP